MTGEDECREGVSARTVRSGGTAAASAAAATAPDPAPATTATTTTWPVNHPPCWLPNESRARDEPTKYQPRNARPSCTVPTLSSPYHHRHVSMSPPPLLLSSPAPIAATRNHLNMSGHRNVVTPPDTPADRSPPSPGNKLNRSQHLPREATGSVSPGLPAATLDLSSAATTNSPHELSTLV
ncbi:uncharacterized protein LOC117240763 isoform X2 [Bombus vosnesenskii]|uniref:Uncharacterized protein LOC117240763 isoform X2 n=1 Tax=Bombus vosnesenskii TaxID=207650 RepID=A0A6J3LDC9_9HYME|nr:uncharacterized protein LOC117240763 isoform X2 [Bombus vosnesenskii]